jgi:hypothetical protein
MGFFKKISSLFQSTGKDRNYWFYVQCDHCQEIIQGRIDMHSALSLQYGEGKSGNTYYCRKVMIGSKGCYKQIEVEFTFDTNHKLIDRQIQSGKFVTETEFLEAQAVKNG